MCSMLVVEDIQKSRKFYTDVMGFEVVSDFGENITFSCGLALQLRTLWSEFIDGNDVSYGGNDSELYFEENNIEDFAKRLEDFDIEYVHKLKEHPWGQRVIRFYDVDRHIIEIGENMEVVCKRFLQSGMSVEEVSKRTMYPVSFIENL